MLQEIIHIGLTVTDLNRSISFYKDVLGLKLVGQISMAGEETDRLFNHPHTKAEIAYLNGSDFIAAPPIELIQFTSPTIKPSKADLFKPSISEVCFKVKNIEKVYAHLLNHQVECISPPQSFDFSSQGFGKSQALYFKDPDGIILELMEYME